MPASRPVLRCLGEASVRLACRHSLNTLQYKQHNFFWLDASRACTPSTAPLCCRASAERALNSASRGIAQEERAWAQQSCLIASPWSLQLQSRRHPCAARHHHRCAAPRHQLLNRWVSAAVAHCILQTYWQSGKHDWHLCSAPAHSSCACPHAHTSTAELAELHLLISLQWHAVLWNRAWTFGGQTCQAVL